MAILSLEEINDRLNSPSLDDHERVELLIQKKQAILLSKCSTDYKAFVKLFWKYQSGDDFRPNFGTDAIIEHMMAAKRREIRRLIINIPPRNAKSSLTSISFPPFVWLTAPREKFYYLSYSLELTKDNLVRGRNIILSEPYSIFTDPNSPDYVYSLASDMNTKTKIFNNRSGHLITGSPKSGTLGKGYSIGLIDDLSSSDDPNELNLANTYFSEKFKDRADNQSTNVIIIIMQKLGKGDLTDYVLSTYKSENWIRLVIPLERDALSDPIITNFESAKIKEDPRQIGESIDYERYPPSVVESLKIDQKIWQTKYQQRNPSKDLNSSFIDPLSIPVSDKQIHYSWFDYIVTGWDTAVEVSKTANYTVGITGGLYKDIIYIFDMFRGQYDLLRRIEYFKYYAKKYSMVKQFHSVEKANVGVTLIKYFQDMGIDVKAHSSGEFGSKDNKRSLLADAIKAGKVVLLNSNPFIDLKIFPESTYVIEDIKEELCSLDAVNDDIMDAMFLMVAHFILSDNKFFIEAHLPDPDPEWIRTSDGYKLIKDVSVLDEYDFYEFTHIPADYFSIDF